MVAAIVGYTNAGKSTLLNKLTGADILAADMLFATLDPTVRMLELNDGQEILLTDTVGFIRKLPHHLIEAFRSTLEESKYADIIIHVVDASNPEAYNQMEVVYSMRGGRTQWLYEEICRDAIPALVRKRFGLTDRKMDLAGAVYERFTWFED